MMDVSIQSVFEMEGPPHLLWIFGILAIFRTGFSQFCRGFIAQSRCFAQANAGQENQCLDHCLERCDADRSMNGLSKEGLLKPGSFEQVDRNVCWTASSQSLDEPRLICCRQHSKRVMFNYAYKDICRWSDVLQMITTNGDNQEDALTLLGLRCRRTQGKFRRRVHDDTHRWILPEQANSNI